MTAPLSGLQVLDLTSGVAGPYATKLLADFGADVLKVEPPEGDEARREGPFLHGQPHPEGSGRFLFLNTNKRSIVLELERPGDRDVVQALAAQSDVVFEDLPPGRMAALGLSYDNLEQLRPGIVLVSITPWGQSGPYLNFRLTDLVAQAMGGAMLWTGTPSREPLRLGGGGALALQQAGAVSAVAALTAIYRQQLTGEGDHVDVSIYDTQAGSRDRVQTFLVNYVYDGAEPRRQPPGGTLATGMRPCRDGFVNILGGGARLPSFLRMIGRPDLAALTDLRRRSSSPAFVDEVEATYLGWLSEQTMAETTAAAQAAHLLAAPVNTVAGLLSDEHFRQRGAWETIDHPQTGPLEYPGRPFIMSATLRPPARRAPLLDEHGAEIRAALTVPMQTASSTRRVAGGNGRLPLAGVRVADITVVWAGPHVTQLLSEWGADVIRVEPISRIQPATRWAERRSTRAEEQERGRLGIASGGGYPDFDPGERPWDRNGSFNSHARNKRSMVCDVMTAEGRAEFLRLISCCDVIVENNVPTTIDRAGIAYEQVARIRPDIIMLRMPAFGLSGPYRGYRAYGTHLEGLIGHHHLRGYPEGTPDEGGDVYTADAAGGIHGALAVLMALYHRQRTGQGQQIELAQAECFLSMLAEPILDWTMNREERGPWGNRHRSHAPHQAYPCAGEDEWIAIDVADDAEFAALCGVIGCPELTADLRFATARPRWEHQDELDTVIAERTRGRDKFSLFRELQNAGVAAGPLQTAAERLRCPQLEARQFFVELEQKATGSYLYPGLIWRMARTPGHFWRGPAALGEDNGFVYKDLLGMTAAEYGRRCGTGAIGTRYLPEAFAALG